MAMLYIHSVGNQPQNTMVVFKMRDSLPSARYSPVCNVLRQWKSSLIPTYRVYRLYDKKPKWRFLTSRGTHLNCAIMSMTYTHSIGNQPRTRWWCLKCVIVYLARDIRPFVMYCVNGKPRSSQLIESTDSMILILKTEKTF